MRVPLATPPSLATQTDQTGRGSTPPLTSPVARLSRVLARALLAVLSEALRTVLSTFTVHTLRDDQRRGPVLAAVDVRARGSGRSLRPSVASYLLGRV